MHAWICVFILVFKLNWDNSTRCVFVVISPTIPTVQCEGGLLRVALCSRNYMRRGSSNSSDGRRLIFVGTQPDLITIHFVKHNQQTGIMKLKKVGIIDEWWGVVKLPCCCRYN